jgi:formamidase
VETIIKVDVTKPANQQDGVIHNRWHPDIPMVTMVKPGDEFRVECLDWTGGQIKNDDCANDIRDVDLTQVHYLSGPIGVEGAEPGDLMVVDILDVGVLKESEWGFTGLFAKENGGGFLTEHYPEANKACWDFHGIYTSSRHIPGVEFAGIMHPGLIGCLPSKELLEEWNRREGGLVATDPERVPPLAALPYAETAVMGRMKPDEAAIAAKEGARTVPPREHGGNCDIKNLSRLFSCVCKRWWTVNGGYSFLSG